MVHMTETIFLKLVAALVAWPEVQAIGNSGGSKPLPKPGEGDIDVFIYTDMIPGLEQRKALFCQFSDLLQDSKVNVFSGGHWGVADFTRINGMEVWLMYFTTADTVREVEAILRGEFPDRLDNYYYPVGRCAMLLRINIRYEQNGFLSRLKERLSVYPPGLARVLTEHHGEALSDREDLERAVKRQDVLFYHFALDLALDHFLQALFAMNRVYFPSRKRNLACIDRFASKPAGCSARLLEIIRLGGCADTIADSYDRWQDIVTELLNMDSSMLLSTIK